MEAQAGLAVPFCVPCVQLPQIGQLGHLLTAQPVDFKGHRRPGVGQIQDPEPGQALGGDRFPVRVDPGQEGEGQREDMLEDPGP